MKDFSWAVNLALSLTVAFGWSVCEGLAQNEGPPSAEEMEKAWRAFAKPGKQHEQFKRLVGNWKTTAKSYYENPEQPSVTEGTATFRLLMGGRFLQQRYVGEHEGRRFVGRGLTGYDNAKQKYVGTWIDSMGTGIMTTEGTYDAETHSMIEQGTSSSPFGPMKVKLVSKYTDDDRFVFTMYMVMDDGEQKALEITYERTKNVPETKADN